MAIAIEDMTPRAALTYLSAQIESLDASHVGKKIDKLSHQLEILTEKVTSMDTLYYGLLQSILVEFNDHRSAFILLLEANGIPCDDITGWTMNNDKELDHGRNHRKSKRNARKAKKRKRRANKKIRGKKHAT